MTGAMGFIRKLINRVWWGDGWAQDEVACVEPDTVESTGGKLPVSKGAIVRVGDALVAGPDGTVAVGEHWQDGYIGRAIEDFEHLGGGIFSGKVSLG